MLDLAYLVTSSARGRWIFNQLVSNHAQEYLVLEVQPVSVLTELTVGRLEFSLCLTEVKACCNATSAANVIIAAVIVTSEVALSQLHFALAAIAKQS